MLGTNKLASIDFLDSDEVYSSGYPIYRCRIEPKKYSEKSYMTKSMHCVYKIFGADNDTKVGDKITIGDLSYVVAGNAVFGDTLGRHNEMLVRQLDSPYHEEVIIKKTSEVQPNYDPVLQEWEGDSTKSYSSSVVNVLLDIVEGAKSMFITIVPAGKLEGIEYIMTVDFPGNIDTKDRVEYQGETFLIKWKMKFPYQYLYGLTKDVKNYE